MIRSGRKSVALLAFAATLGAVITAGSAQAQTAASSASGITVEVKAGNQVPLLQKVTVAGTLTNPAPNDNVQLTVTASGREVASEKLNPSPDGTFEYSLLVEACCSYEVTAQNADKKATASFGVRVPKTLPRKGPVTKLFNESLQAQGFHTGTKGSKVTSGTRLAIKAFRKVNKMSRSVAYRPSIFRTLLQGEGAYNVRYPNAGKHVEVDLSEQTMSLIQGDRPVHTFHVSTGTGGTPTVRGRYRFYRKEPGTNNVGMYFSVYFIRGYATHGYKSVPNYNASHGCVRNPPEFSKFIYNWIDLGDSIYVYG